MSTKTNIAVAVIMLASIILTACSSAATATQSSAPAVNGAANNTQPAQQAAAGSVQVNGAGSTFADPVYSDWIYAYQTVDPSVALNYQGIGSGGGKKGIIDRTLDFAGSDSVLTDTEYQKGGDLQMYPMLSGAVVVIYNLEGVDPAKSPALIFDRQTLADIYLGKIKTWNDPAIVKLNPGLASILTNKPITVAHRSDGSGTTEIFTNALAAFSSDWKTNVGAGSAVEWPVDKAGHGVGGKGNQGVAGVVQNTKNSIGYVELQFAVANKIPFAQMVNKAGKTVTADATSLASAMSDFANSFNDKLTTTIVDGGGDATWPIAGYTYIILHTTSMDDCTKAAKILQFMKWGLTDKTAADHAAKLGYSVLPANVQTKVLSKLSQMTCKGQPVLK